MEENDGLISRDDLAAYQARIRPPVRTVFRGFDVYGMGPPSSGGIVLCQMLNILENYDLRADGAAAPRTLHRVTEAMRRAFFTRATRLADADFVDVPVADLISKATARELARSIGDHATRSAELASFPILAPESDHTTHFSVLDSSGNAVALTYTLEDGYGAKAVVAGAGFLLNNEMGDFNLIPGRTDTTGRIGTPANEIAPRKRMLSSMTPTLVLKDEKVALVTGSPWGQDDTQHHALGRAQRARIRTYPRRGRCGAEDSSSVVSRRPAAGRRILARFHKIGPGHDGTQGADHSPPGQCEHHRRCSFLWPDPWHPRSSTHNHQSIR